VKQRGPYAKGKAKRAEILNAALRIIDQQGYSAATVKNLADAVGLSQMGLLHYFGSKEALFLDILRHNDDVTAVKVDAAHTDFSQEIVSGILRGLDEQVASSGMTQLTLRVVGEATEPDHMAHEFVRNRYEWMREIVTGAIGRLQAAGRLPAELNANVIATLVFAAWDGLQMQWMYDPNVNAHACMVYLLKALGIEPTEPTADDT